MFEQFINKAMSEIWCNPFMDRASIIQPQRIAVREGIKREFRLPWTTLTLPNQSDRFYLYQIGHIPNTFLGIFKRYSEWTTFSKVCMDNELNCDFYIHTGIEIAKSHVFLKRDGLGTLFVAVRYYEHMPNVRTNDLFMRFYANAFKESVRANGLDELIYINGGLLDSTARKLEILNDYYNGKAEGIGYTYLQYNGVEYGHLTPSQVIVGNTLEYLHDRAVKESIDFKVSDLPTFTSQMDSKAKYLLHIPKEHADTIDYYDDIDILLIVPINDIEGNYKGIRYHTNAVDAVRMVTHNDYSIPTDYVEEFVANNPDILNLNDLVIRVNLKHSGYQRALAPNSSLTNELYKLTDEEIVQSLTGFGATLPEWRAENLEQATHTLLYSNLKRFTVEEVLEAYGYDSSMKILFDTPLKVEDDGGTPEFRLPYGLQQNSTVYEFDEQGLLLGFYNHTNGPEYYPRNAGCKLIEVHRGRTSQSIDMVVGENASSIVEGRDYKFYILTAVDSSGVDGDWVPAVEGEHYYFSNGNVRWDDIDLRQKTPLVVSDHFALGYTTDVSIHDGMLCHRVVRYEEVNSVMVSTPLEIPMGKLDVWLNGHALIEDVDFIIKDRVELIIFNKEYLRSGDSQTLTVRWAGHWNHGYGDFNDYQIGFVNQGLLSANNKYDVRDNRLIRCIVGGKTIAASDLTFQEEHTGVYVVDEIRDGTPYLIEYTKPPLWDVRDFVPEDYREQAMEFTGRVNAIMTARTHEPPLPPVVTTDRRYTLFSVFIGAILAAMKNGIVEVEHGQLHDDQLESLAQPYLPLLDVDPCRLDLALSKELMVIHPHPFLEDINVTLFEYNVLERLSHKYLNSKVDMTQFVTVGETC
jgi:hypothetical protein